MVSRRIFIRNGSLALVSLGFAPSFLTRTAEAAGGARQKALIAIFQRGAVDGLNMVIPFGERAYYSARPSIAIPKPGAGNDSAVDLDGFFGLHPRLSPLKRLYHEHHLAIVHACGSHDETRSHFDAQDYMESGTPGVKGTGDGWLNRCLHEREHQQASPFRGVAISSQLPRALQGSAPALALSRLDQFGIRGQSGDLLQASFEEQYAAAADALLRPTASETFEAVRMMRSISREPYRPAAGATYPRTPLGEALQQIAQLIKADVGLEIAFTESTGWDHHVNEGAATGQMAARLDDLAGGIAALTTDLGDLMQDVVVLTMSEFGRAVEENGNRGTDHGHGNAMFVIGGSVRGGKIYGRWPGLELEQRFERRDLAVTTDFRDVFGEIVVHHLGIANPKAIFPGYEIHRTNFKGFIS